MKKKVMNLRHRLLLMTKLKMLKKNKKLKKRTVKFKLTKIQKLLQIISKKSKSKTIIQKAQIIKIVKKMFYK